MTRSDVWFLLMVAWCSISVSFLAHSFVAGSAVASGFLALAHLAEEYLS